MNQQLQDDIGACVAATIKEVTGDHAGCLSYRVYEHPSSGSLTITVRSRMHEATSRTQSLEALHEIRDNLIASFQLNGVGEFHHAFSSHAFMEITTEGNNR